jgi:hypothetical protein
MKVAWFLVLMMSWTASVSGTGYARVFHQRAEALPSRAREEAAGDHAGNGAKNAGGEGGGGHPAQQQNGRAILTRGASKSRPSRGHFEPPAGGPPHAGQTTARQSFRVGAPGTAIDSGVTRSPSAGVPGGAGDSDRRFVRPPVAAALNGQQFKNAHNPGASLAIRRGPANSSGGTAVIDGTDMKRKP